jgi:coenzyme F420-reducing hydrogenase gamma subunit
MITPDTILAITDPCPFAAHTGPCAELNKFVAETRAGLMERYRTARIITETHALLASPHPCAGCGDITCAALCPACQEWASVRLTMDADSRIIAGMVHSGLVPA